MIIAPALLTLSQIAHINRPAHIEPTSVGDIGA